MDKLTEIVNSYHNGQKSQMVTQIKAYGQRKFCIDFYEKVRGMEYTNPYGGYADIVYTFFLIKDRGDNKDNDYKRKEKINQKLS